MDTLSDELTRPIIGIENRTSQEVFDIMCDRMLALRKRVGDLEGAERKRAVAAIHWVFNADGTVGERAMAQEAIHKINDPTFMPLPTAPAPEPHGDGVRVEPDGIGVKGAFDPASEAAYFASIWKLSNPQMAKLEAASRSALTSPASGERDAVIEAQPSIRICPERDGPCPHGMECPYNRDRYHCSLAASRAAIRSRNPGGRE